METFIPKGNVRGFIMPDFVFRDNRLSLGAKILYAVFCNFAGEKDYCWPSHETLAKLLDCSVSTIKKYIGELATYKLISSSMGNRVRSCVYHLLKPSKDALFSQKEPSQNLPSTQPKSAYNLNLKENNIYIPPISPKPLLCAKPPAYPKTPSFFQRGRGDFSSANKDFEEFFEYYPKKEGKEIARSLWHSLYKKGILPSLEVLRDAINFFGASFQWQKEYGRYVPMAVNFLRGQRWKEASCSTVSKQAASPVTQGTSCAVYEKALQNDMLLKQNHKTHLDTIRPLYNSLASHFSCGVNAVSFGLWSYLHGKGIAPCEKDIPHAVQDMNLLSWLKTFQRNTLYS